MGATERRRRQRRFGRPALLAATLVATLGAGQTSATTIEPVLNDREIDEFGAAVTDGSLAWTEYDDRGELRAYVMPDGGEPLMIGRPDPPGTFSPGVSIWGATGVIWVVGWDRDGSPSSDLRMFDALTGERSAPPEGVNTRADEEEPSISGDWLVFTRRAPWGRGGGPKDRPQDRVILFNLATLEERVLVKIPAEGHWLASGQVNGDWATWESCDGDPVDSWGNCQVYRYRIQTSETEILPNPGLQQYGAGIASDGTAYAVRSGGSDTYACGDGAVIVRVLPDGTSDVVASLAGGKDANNVFAFEEADGSTVLYFDRVRCSDYARNVYRVALPLVQASTAEGRAR